MPIMRRPSDQARKLHSQIMKNEDAYGLDPMEEIEAVEVENTPQGETEAVEKEQFYPPTKSLG